MWLSQTSRTLRNGRSNCLYLATTATGGQEPEVPSFSASGQALFPASCECGCSNLLPQPWLGTQHCLFKEDSQLKTAFSILECKTGKVEAYSNTGRQKSCLSWNKIHGSLCANEFLHLTSLFLHLSTLQPTHKSKSKWGRTNHAITGSTENSYFINMPLW